MVEMAELITPERILLDLRPRSKRQLLQELAELAARDLGIESSRILSALLEREKLGTTAIGEGIAIPHAKIEGLDRIIGGFARLAEPLDFEALDEQPVDLVFFLLAPAAASTEHLKALARLARLLRNPELRARLRSESDIGRVYKLLVGGAQSHAA